MRCRRASHSTETCVEFWILVPFCGLACLEWNQTNSWRIWTVVVAYRYVASDARTINELWIGKDLEGSHCRRSEILSQNMPEEIEGVRIADVPAEIQTEYLILLALLSASNSPCWNFNSSVRIISLCGVEWLWVCSRFRGPVTVAARSKTCLRSLGCWDRGFESHSRHGYLCVYAFILCLCCPVFR
jgi:hypothetical protein